MKKILFYPYKTDISTYIGMMRYMVGKHYNVIDYSENKHFIDGNVAAIYLNWIEDIMDEEDKLILSKASNQGIKIIWVFHNKVSHSKAKQNFSLSNIKFLANVSDNVIIHSHNSCKILETYGLFECLKKVIFIPHPEYINNYGFIESDEVPNKAKNKKCVFGFIGNVREDKNALLTIKAFKRMKYKEDSLLLISGKASSTEYGNQLSEEVNGENNIIFENKKIKSYMMGFYMDVSDIILMPYDTLSCMNSGVMLLAFSNKKTVISSDMSMAMDYSEDLIYRYTYVENQEAHLKVLTEMMEKAYEDGQNVLRQKGNALYQDVLLNNSKQIVENMLVSLIGTDKGFYLSDNNMESLRFNATRKRGKMAAGLLSEIMEGNFLFKSLANKKDLSIGIYAWGKLGKYVKKLLDDNGAKLTCIIDQNENIIVDEISVFSLDNLKIELDIVIVTTPLVDMEQIKNVCLSNNPNCYVLDLEDLE